LNQKCPDCKLIGNAFEYGHQRGSVVHATHLSTVENNVYNDIRGANIYIEDGNEMYNKINYNVAVCPWPREGEKRGCALPGKNLIGMLKFNVNISLKNNLYRKNCYVLSNNFAKVLN
jgi:hypothetical protein